jgi:hypothetical protein
MPAAGVAPKPPGRTGAAADPGIRAGNARANARCGNRHTPA